MNRLRAPRGVLVLLSCAALLAGCPFWGGTPAMRVAPPAVSFGSESTTQTFTISNTGSGVLAWTLEEVAWVEDTSGVGGWVARDLPWLSLDKDHGRTKNELSRITLTANRTGMSSGTVSGTGVRIVSNAGTEVVRVSITVPASMIVSPTSLVLNPNATSEQFTIQNSGTVSQNWHVDFLTDATDTSSTTALPAWLTVQPSSGSLNAGQTVTIQLSWTTTPGSFALLVTTDTGMTVVKVGPADFTVTPSPLVLYGVGSENTLVIRNQGTASLGWRITFNNIAVPSGTVPVSADPAVGTTISGGETSVLVKVTESDPDNIIFGEGAYELRVETEKVTFRVPLRIEALSLPEILVSKPPDPNVTEPPPVAITSLDFGEESYQEQFYIGNLGPVGSTLYFVITHEDQDAAEPIIESVAPSYGDTDGDENVFYLAERTGPGYSETGPWIYAAPITVTINRNNVVDAVEYRKITITAYDSAYQNPLDNVEPVELTVRVERPPIRFEGAQHRSRPPFMLRFVFLLRDALGNAINTQDDAIFAQLQNAFTVFEDGRQLTSETNSFVTHADDLRYNLVMLLDYTGSMRDAAAADPRFADSSDPLQELYAGDHANPGEPGLVGKFIQDLPDSYNVSLMEYHDRQQESRVIHGFSTNEDALTSALDGFALPAAAHGVSELYDALTEACERLAAQDEGTEPFITDADVRAIVFLSDGKDTSSSATQADVIDLAKELKVRLYPIAFGENANTTPLIALATETGGHFYRAKTVSGVGKNTLDALLARDPEDTTPGAPGRIVTELGRQIVLSYISPMPASAGAHNYVLQVDYDGNTGSVENQVLVDENFVTEGDVRAGQISMLTSGVANGAAEVYVRAEYVPRNVSQFRFRLVASPARAITADNIELTGLTAASAAKAQPWRLIEEGNNVFTLITDESNPLAYGAFGNLFKITFAGVDAPFDLQIRMDNSVYGPPTNSFMQYPMEALEVGDNPDIVAVKLQDILLISDHFDPTASGAFDQDGDGTRDFDDPYPLDQTQPIYLVMPKSLNFGETSTTASLQLTNGRYDNVQWQITSVPAGIALNPTGATLQSLLVGGQTEIAVTLDRSTYAPGSYTRSISLAVTNAISLGVEHIEIPVQFVVRPSIGVDPTRLTFPAWVDRVPFTITNTGTDAFNWHITVQDPAHPASTTPPSFMLFEPGTLTGSTAAGAQSAAALSINRTDPALTAYGNYDYTVTLTATTAGGVARGSVTMPVRIVVAGTPALEVTSNGTLVDLVEGLWILNGQEALAIRLANLGDEPLTWSLGLTYMDDPGTPASSLPITLSPKEGVIASNANTPVTITVDQASLLQVLGEGNHAFRLSITWDLGVYDIPLTINLLPLPEIAPVKAPEEGLESQPVEFLSTLDFGKDEYQMPLYIANIGHQDSELYFRVEHQDQTSTKPLIADVRPMEGSPENDPNAGYFEYNNKLVAASPMLVTIDRNNIQGAVDIRTLTLVPMDSTFTRELTAVDRKEIKIRVERSPLILEGAQNRSRPPFMLRFVFLMRDGYGNAIDTLDPTTFGTLQNAFSVWEDEQRLASTETNHFVTYANDLRYNLVTLLDYSGSMYAAAREALPGSEDPLQELYAGNPSNPADEGVIGAFLRDLPDTYQNALMEYHDRQQPNRLIHGFNTSDDTLISALKNFSLPAGMHGASQVRDALIEACQRLEENDRDALPLVEDADVRAIVFITDGWDTSSSASINDVVNVALATRARLYPIAFGTDVNLADLITMAQETGGHLYRARAIQDYAAQDLMDLLASDTQTQVEDAPGRVAYELARQIVLTYITLLPGSHSYRVRADYQGQSGYIENDAVLTNNTLNGDIRAGQISMTTTGIANGSAEVFIRAEYVPRNISRFRFRLITPPGISINAGNIERIGLLTDNGIPPDDWRVIDEGNQVFTVLTSESGYLPYGSFGNLLKITLNGLTGSTTLGLRVDNSIYAQPPYTTFFQYPFDALNINAGESSVDAVALDDILLVSDAFNPDATGAFDADHDGTRDFDDPAPLDNTIPEPLVSPTTVDFGTTNTAMNLHLANGRFDNLAWSVSESLTWLSVAQGSGQLNVGQESDVALNVNRAGLIPGTHTGRVMFNITTPGGASVERIDITVRITVPPSLRVTPASISFPATVIETGFTLANVGANSFNWQIDAVNPANPNQAVTLPAGLLTFAPGMTGAATAGSQTQVTVRVDRTGLALGTYTYMLRIATTPSAGMQLLPVQIVVAGQPELHVFQKQAEITDANPVWMKPGEPATELVLRNTGSDDLTWSLALAHAPVTGQSLPIGTLPVAIDKTSGVINPDGETKVTITVDQTALLAILGEGTHRFRITIPWDLETRTLWFNIDLTYLPVVSVASPYGPNQLDFGDDPDTMELTFNVANIGALYSKLNYVITVPEQEEGVTEQKPLLVAGIMNDDELNTGTLWRTSEAAVPYHTIRVQIDRSVMQNPVEYRTIQIRDSKIESVAPAEVTVRVEQAPLTIEGAINRSRPPYVMRFVFLLRDMLGRAIPTLTSDDRAKLSFQVEEDNIALDPDETSQFITGPENLKYNIVLLLDYSGSMYNAGVNDETNPLEPGDALAQMVEAAKGFIDDLPDGYRVALMEYHDRQQSDRLIHGFSTDKDALKSALTTFYLAPADHGASEVRDAIIGACDLLVAEDPVDTIPFDDADVRAVVVITDGWDTSSINNLNDTTQYAMDRRVRIYPLGYNAGANVNNAGLVKLAQDTNGHVYYAPSATDLDLLLANQYGLALDTASGGVDGLEADVDLVNTASDQSLAWNLDYNTGSWLSVPEPHAAALLPGERFTIHLDANATGLAPGQYVEDICIESETLVGTGANTRIEPLSATIRAQLLVPNAGTPVLSLQINDEQGRVWRELRNQIVLTYVSLVQEGQHKYLVRATYTDNGNDYTGSFQEDAVYWSGDVRQGQVSLWTTGITQDALGAYHAEAYVRSDYVPRNISQFRFRFYMDPPDDLTPASLAALNNVTYDVELAPDGLLQGWRLIAQGDGVYTVLTEQDSPLKYGAFGNLVKLTFNNIEPFVDTFAGLEIDPHFEIGFRIDNMMYYSPATPPSTPSATRYFVYPGAHLNKGRNLVIGYQSNTATPAKTPMDLTILGFDPEDPLAWDPDQDNVLDFDDPAPFDPAIPAAWVTPKSVVIGATQNQAQFLIRNNRFDTTSWAITALPAWISSPAVGANGVLAPGDSTTITLQANRAGLAPGVYLGEVSLISDFGDEKVNVSLTVP